LKEQLKENNIEQKASPKFDPMNFDINRVSPGNSSKKRKNYGLDELKAIANEKYKIKDYLTLKKPELVEIIHEKYNKEQKEEEIKSKSPKVKKVIKEINESDIEDKVKTKKGNTKLKDKSTKITKEMEENIIESTIAKPITPRRITPKPMSPLSSGSIQDEYSIKELSNKPPGKIILISKNKSILIPGKK
jgi:N-acetylmuramoyl-L-alanine amidase CwlA